MKVDMEESRFLVPFFLWRRNDMREKKRFAERSRVLASSEVKKKIFLVYEGEKTEALYFGALDALKVKLRIDPLIELVPIIRSYNEMGWSNPKKVLDRIIKNLDETKTGEISYETFFNSVIDFYDEQGKLSGGKKQKQSLWNTLLLICTSEHMNNLSDIIEDIETEGMKILKMLADRENVINVAEHISEILQIQKLTYSEGFDQICLIVDRDPLSFTEEQYEQVVYMCDQRKIDFYVTNPCFEFWLLLHFEDHTELDPIKIKENKKISKNTSYLESELKKRLGRYKKHSYDAEKIVQKIDVAIKSSEDYCTDLKQLKCNIGSNLNQLIKTLRP